MNFLKSTVVLACFLLISFSGEAQQIPCELVNGRWQLADGSPCPNAIITTVPFLRITPDARAAAMGDAGIATSADASSMAFNDSKTVFSKEKYAAALSYTPWFRSLGINDIALTYASGFMKLGDIQAIGLSLRYFTMGEIDFTDIQGEPLGKGRPNEFEIKAMYARKLTDNLSAAIGPKFIFSDLASGQRSEQSSDIIKAGRAVAADISFTYQKTIQGSFKREVTLGVAATNIGSKIAYTSNVSDLLPANLGIGYGWKAHLDDFNTLTLTLDVNKLLVPTPRHLQDPELDTDGNGIADYREKAVFEAITESFSDAPDGFREELRELMISAGMEYWYDNQFAMRLGYFYEHSLKGNRRYITAGIGLKYNIIGINLSYLVPTNNVRSPLDNTLRFTLTFDLSNVNKKDGSTGEN
jgi:hypothetical protein